MHHPRLNYFVKLLSNLTTSMQDHSLKTILTERYIT